MIFGQHTERMKNFHDPSDVRSPGGGIQFLGNLRNL
jgi:hypothetical protein